MLQEGKDFCRVLEINKRGFRRAPRFVPAGAGLVSSRSFRLPNCAISRASFRIIPRWPRRLQRTPPLAFRGWAKA